MTHILICTVGGSYQPLVTAIKEQQPDFVLFICTNTDPATGRPGSSIQITGAGNCIKANQNDAKPSLPNIPNQAGLSSGQYDICLTVADDLDQIYLDCTAAITQLLQRFPNAKLIADYTGGTKSMTAGLVMAALEHQTIELQLVTGSRADLIKVNDGSQNAEYANIERIRFERLLSPYRQAWTRYAYSEAESGLNQLSAPRGDVELRGQFTRFRELSRAFSEWDNFNHQAAQSIIKDYAPKLPDNFKVYLASLNQLNDINLAKRDAARLLDLYLNALRRAAQGRYDDAIARVYRLIEWTAQWLLKTQFGIETSKINAEDIPEGVNLSPNREGHYQAALFDAWQLVKHKSTGAAAQFISTEKERLLHHLNIRNSSILAHGFEPVIASDWQNMQTWLEQQFIPMLLAEVTRVGIKGMPAQLPNHYFLQPSKQPAE